MKIKCNPRLDKAGICFKTIAKQLSEKVTTVDAIIRNGSNKISANLPRSGAPWKISPRGVSMIKRTVMNQSETTKEDDLRAAGTIAPKKTIGNTIGIVVRWDQILALWH